MVSLQTAMGNYTFTVKPSGGHVVVHTVGKLKSQSLVCPLQATVETWQAAWQTPYVGLMLKRVQQFLVSGEHTH